MSINYNYKSSNIWKKTLERKKESDEYNKQRSFLRNSFENFRRQAIILANEIPIELKEFTVHDITHIDALWEMVDIVIHEDFEINPAEAFVLGGAILLHDLGLALAAYPEGLDEIKKEIYWSDTVVSIYRNKLNREPTEDEIFYPEKQIEKLAITISLRHFHAKRAEILGQIHWRSKANPSDVHYLIENSEIRETFGKIIGLIAHSHWWSTEELSNKLDMKIGAATFLPKEWTIDPLKIACLLRVADIIHIDDRRAPSFLWSLRDLSKLSNLHWNFQNKIVKPIVVQLDKLQYSSKSPFKINELNTWWLCYDTLIAIDQELKTVNSLLIDSNRNRLVVNGISNIESPKKISKTIETESWTPIDTKIQIGDVANLIKRLGGTELYGDDYLIPLRELIQNSCDAIRARRLLESKNEKWGNIIISDGNDEKGYYLEICDNGVGMSESVLTGPFLDFGLSFWDSNLSADEFPGLQTKKFTSTGKFGIGFFSAFMWGDQILIRTRKFNKSHDDTICLEFKAGLEERPILRRAEDNERINDGGTNIKIWFREGNKLLDRIFLKKKTLKNACIHSAFAIDANLFIKNQKVIKANDWLKIKNDKFIKRTAIASQTHNDNAESDSILGKTSDFIYDKNDKIIGRGFISSCYNYPGFVISNNGIRTGVDYDPERDNIGTVHGIFEGIPLNAARTKSQLLITQKDLNDWVTLQLGKINILHLQYEEKLNYTLSGISLGGSPKNLDLPFAITLINKKQRYVGYAEIIDKFKNREYCILQSAHFSDSFDEKELHDYTILIDTSYQHQKILNYIKPYDEGRQYSRNTGIYWSEMALKEAWKINKLKINYYDGDNYDTSETIKKLNSELEEIGTSTRLNISEDKRISQTYIGIARRY